MSKDRARPFSHKHRRYWIPVTGGMLLIGALNLGIGFCSYTSPPPPPTRIIPALPPPTRPALRDGEVLLGDVPLAVMRAFTMKYPRQIPLGARKLSAPEAPGLYELTFGDPATRVTFREDGTLVAAP